MAAGRKKILLIEDNPDNSELVRFLLERAGYDVVCAFDGMSGLEKAMIEIPNLILLDMAMPEMDGWQTAKALKASEITGEIPLVALTAFTLPGDKQRALDSGCDAYISKPLKVAEFAAEVKSYLKD